MNTIQKVSTVPQLDFLERLETRKVRKVVKRSNLFEELDDYEFQRRFRLTKESVEELTLRVSQNGIINCMCRQKTLSNRSMPSSKEVLCAHQKLKLLPNYNVFSRFSRNHPLLGTMSHSGSSAKRPVSNSLSQWSDLPSDASQHSLSSHHHHHRSYDPEWDAKEELRLRELEEARARAAQMEKTMRWWSDCTANWREKWSKVRTERNKAREETRVLRGKLEVAAKECNTLKREKQDLYSQIERLKKENQLFNGNEEFIDEKKEDIPYTGQNKERVIPERDVGPGDKMTDLGDALITNALPKATKDDNEDDENVEISSTVVEVSDCTHTNPDLQFLDKFLKQDCKEPLTISTIPGMNEKKGSRLSNRGIEDFNIPVQELTEQKMAMLQLRLDEASKTIIAERQEKNKLMKSIDKLQTEYNQLRMKYEDMKKSKQDTMKELSQIKAEHQDEIDNMRLDLEDEANSRSNLDQRVAELRSELERLQGENAAEWGRRERLETEKLALERENKKLRTQIEDLDERLERKTKQMTLASDSDVKALQIELHEKNKELADLKHAHTKLKKVLQDKSTELAHALRRSEQYEAEVKKLRGRIEELKKELAAAEDEVDAATNNIRKLQRTNDELQEQVESLQVQVEHLQSRLRNSASHALLTRHANSSFTQVDPMSEDDNLDF
ncbi:coiled-coil domain-containing protein 102B [Trichonephila inaurata madagascariensis]|uniref:Coiled-coil domain-containing protein 102A n=1 Tax=Trichonephila inaurata madagascariensis TaxID=2747483 RepID=A0A8X7BQI7_9ARAC|nr:coiled-coil domain-containing protein 102B [Trichonephila inaurata madagascariensis]